MASLNKTTLASLDITPALTLLVQGQDHAGGVQVRHGQVLGGVGRGGHGLVARDWCGHRRRRQRSLARPPPSTVVSKMRDF